MNDNGLFIGQVVDAVGDEQKIGRVKIKLAAYPGGYETWARVAQLYAGKDYGSTWIPEKGCEVLVSFPSGATMAEPCVVGCLHSTVDPPPEPRTDKSDVKTLKTLAGSELRFDEGKGIIDLKTPSGASIRLEEKAGAITLTSTKKIDLTAPNITIEAAETVTIKGKDVTILGSNSVAIN